MEMYKFLSVSLERKKDVLFFVCLVLLGGGLEWVRLYGDAQRQKISVTQLNFISERILCNYSHYVRNK